MHAYTWGRKGVLFREVSSVQECPYIEWFHCTLIPPTVCVRTGVDQ